MRFFARMKRISLIALPAALVSCSTNANRPALPPPTNPDADAVAAAVQHTFDGLAAHDSTMLAAVILPDANFQRWGADSTGTWRTVNLEEGLHFDWANLARPTRTHLGGRRSRRWRCGRALCAV